MTSLIEAARARAAQWYPMSEPWSAAAAAALDTDCIPHDVVSSAHDMVFREAQCTLLSEWYNNTTSTSDLRVFFALMDMAISMTQAGTVEDTLPFLLLEELLDALTLDACDAVFSFLEHRLPYLRANLMPNKGKGLILLRLCNDLLRRLSKTQHPIFCGRILILIASVFPLAERSGVNQRGDFNLDNVTVFEGRADVDWQTLKQKPEEEREAIPLEAVLVGDRQQWFYRLFWSLQLFFNHPNSLLQKPEAVTYLQHAMDIVFAIFDQAREQERKVQSKVTAATTTTTAAMPPMSPKKRRTTSRLFYAKYLTRPNLLNLEIMDPQFRRTIAVQSLILLEHMLQLVNQKLPEYKHVDRNEVLDLRDRVYAYFESGDTDGKAFAYKIQRIMSQERSWVQWKLNSCPALDVAPEPLLSAARHGPAHAFEPAVPFANPELARLWQHANEEGMAALHVPDVKTYLEPLVEQLNPDDMIEKEYRWSQDPVYVWRVLRLATKRHGALFQRIKSYDVEQLASILFDLPLVDEDVEVSVVDETQGGRTQAEENNEEERDPEPEHQKDKVQRSTPEPAMMDVDEQEEEEEGSIAA